MTRLAWVALLHLALPAMAAENERPLPFNVSAKSVEFNEKTQAAVYRGNVVLKQGAMELRADSVEIFTKKNKPERALARGKPVVLSDRTEDRLPIDIRADRVEVLVETREVKLDGNVYIRQGLSKMQAARAVYRLTDKRLEAFGKDDTDRVTAVIIPTEKEKPEDPPNEPKDQP